MYDLVWQIATRNSVDTPESDKKLGEIDSVTHCEPTILQIGQRIGIGPHCEPTILRIGDLEIGEASLYPCC